VKGARRVMDGFGNAPFIFNLGHGVNKDTPTEHVSELVAAVRSWSPGFGGA
jgi:uroporphyrinogen decarboxylase